APRLCRGAPSVGGSGGRLEPPTVEERHGFAGVLRALGGLGGARSPRRSRSATALPGCSERWGVWGAPGAPDGRGAPRLCRGAPSVGGSGGRPEPPTVEERHGFAGVLR